MVLLLDWRDKLEVTFSSVEAQKCDLLRLQNQYDVPSSFCAGWQYDRQHNRHTLTELIHLLKTTIPTILQ